MSNLLANAAEAIVESGEERGRVQVSVGRESLHEVEMVRLRVRDNGGGIAPENLNRVFERGFSTKPGGARGLGLHWCANSIAALKGRMFAESEGIGKGACLHVVIPWIA